MAGKRLAAAVCLISVLLILAAGCGQKQAETSPFVPSQPPESAAPSPWPAPAYYVDEAALDEYREALRSENNEKAAFNLLYRLSPGLPPSDVTWMFLSLEDHQKLAVANGTVLDEELMALLAASEITDEKLLNDVNSIADPALKAALQVVYDRGYKLIVPEGIYEAVINYEAYSGIALPPDLAAYIEIREKESAQRMMEDAALVIPVDAVIERALACEYFQNTYTTSQKLDQIHTLYVGYIDAYFYGADNTPAFDYSANKLNQEFLDSYRKYAPDDRQSAFIAALNGYLTVLEENGYTLSQTVSDRRDSLTETLKINPCYG